MSVLCLKLLWVVLRMKAGQSEMLQLMPAELLLQLSQRNLNPNMRSWVTCGLLIYRTTSTQWDTTLQRPFAGSFNMPPFTEKTCLPNLTNTLGKISWKLKSNQLNQPNMEIYQMKLSLEWPRLGRKTMTTMRRQCIVVAHWPLNSKEVVAVWITASQERWSCGKWVMDASSFWKSWV